MQIWEVNIDGVKRYFESEVEASTYRSYEGGSKTVFTQAITVPTSARELIVLLEGRTSEEAERATRQLKDAVSFFDKVKGASESDKIAVGNDHWNWLESAARNAAQNL